jgi:hypothetical protein
VASAQPQKGLDSNPGTTGEIFSTSHPYFPENCGVCPFNKGVGKLFAALVEKEGNCGECRSVKKYMVNATDKKQIDEERRKRKIQKKQEKLLKKMKEIESVIEESIKQFSKLRPLESIPEIINFCRKEYQQYNNLWKRLFFESSNGGYIVCHEGHQYAHNEKGGEAEIKVAYLLARINGKQVELLPENGQGTMLPDLQFDGFKWDVKRIDKANQESVESAIKNAKKAGRVIFYWEADNNQLDKITNAKKCAKTNVLVYYIDKNGLLQPVK